jgi:hypothetical protein
VILASQDRRFAHEWSAKRLTGNTILNTWP